MQVVNPRKSHRAVPGAQTTRRRLFAGVAATAVATLPRVPTALAAPGTDPCLVIAAERDRLKVIHEGCLARVHAIAEANPEFMGAGYPSADLSLDVFKGMRFKHGAEVRPDDIVTHNFLMPPDRVRALQQWWDRAVAEGCRRAEATGYTKATAELEEVGAAMVEKECELADVQATTLAGVVVRLEAALGVAGLDPDQYAYDRMLLGALADLRRLSAAGRVTATDGAT